MSSLLSSGKDLRFDGRPTPLKTSLFILICLGWLLPGLTGHTPWKYDEAVSQGIVHGLLHGSNWLSPDLAGTPYFNHPPLFYWVAALLAKSLQSILPDHDAARLASGWFMLLTFIGLAIAASSLFGSRAPRAAILIFIGSVGLVIRAHEMSAHLAWLAGISWVLAAIPWARTRSAMAGVMGGLGLGMAFLSQGLLALGLLLPLVMLTPLLIPAYRPAHPLRYGLLWLLTALPAVTAWPILLLLLDPHAFAHWEPFLLQPLLQPARWIDPEAIPPYYLGVITWFAWPAAPLAVAGLWTSGRRGLGTPSTRWLLLCLVLWLPTLGYGTAPRESNALPLLLPLSLLAAGGIDQLKRGASAALDWFGTLTFGLLTSVLWLGWIAQLIGHPTAVVQWLDSQLPGFQARFHWAQFTLSLAITLLWLLTIIHSRPSPRRAVINWTVGMTVSWILVMTLWLPYVEASRSYAPMMQALQRALPAHFNCLESSGLGEPQRGLLYYYLNLRTRALELEPHARCNLWLVQSHPEESFVVPAGWHLRWSGARNGDRGERFQLFEH